MKWVDHPAFEYTVKVNPTGKKADAHDPKIARLLDACVGFQHWEQQKGFRAEHEQLYWSREKRYAWNELLTFSYDMRSVTMFLDAYMAALERGEQPATA